MAAPRLAAGQLVDVCPERGAQHWYDAEVLSVDGDDAVLRLFDMDEEDELMSISVSRFRREQLLAPFQSWTANIKHNYKPGDRVSFSLQRRGRRKRVSNTTCFGDLVRYMNAQLLVRYGRRKKRQRWVHLVHDDVQHVDEQKRRELQQMSVARGRQSVSVVFDDGDEEEDEEEDDGGGRAVVDLSGDGPEVLDAVVDFVGSDDSEEEEDDDDDDEAVVEGGRGGAAGAPARELDFDFDAIDDAPEFEQDMFRDPVTLEVMRNPVVARDGHTYDYATISSWLAKQCTSPLTNEPLPSAELLPNHSIRKLMQEAYKEFRARSKDDD